MFGTLAIMAWLAMVAILVEKPPPARFSRADAAIVLGSRLYDGKPGPSLAARVRAGADLVKSGNAPLLILTGGKTHGEALSEAQGAAILARNLGLRDDQIWVESRSQSTLENLRFADARMKSRGLQRAFVVSDRTHLRRAMILADGLGLEASPVAANPHLNALPQGLAILREAVTLPRDWLRMNL